MKVLLVNITVLCKYVVDVFFFCYNKYSQCYTSDLENTLSKFSYWSPYILTLVLKVRFGFTKSMLL